MPGKVLYTASTFLHIENFHLPYIRFLSGRGFAVTVLAGGEKREVPYAPKSVFMSFKKRFFSPSNFVTAFKIANIIRKERFDVIITNTALAAFFTRLAVIIAGKGSTFVINISHGYLFDGRTNPIKRFVLLAAEKMTAKVTDLILTMNGEDTKIAVKHRLARTGVRKIDGMGVDSDRLRGNNAHREAFGVSEKDFVLIYAAEFSKRKNQKMLIRALSGLPQDIKLFLPGSGALRESCMEIAEPGRVFFPGYSKKISEFYSVSDVCVSSSRIEGLPFNIMEGMAMGLPVIASRVKGHEDLIKDGENGFLFEYNNLSEFRRAVLSLYNDRRLLAEISENNREAAEKYSLGKVYPQITGILETYIPELRGEPAVAK